MPNELIKKGISMYIYLHIFACFIVLPFFFAGSRIHIN